MRTILHHLLERNKEIPNLYAIQYKSNERWLHYTWADLYQSVETIGAGLTSLGVNKEDRIAIVSETRPEWIMTDLATMGVGAVTVPIYPNNLDEDVEFILNNALVRIIFLENKEQLYKWRRINKKCKTVEKVVVINNDVGGDTNALKWQDLLALGHTQLKENPMTFIEKAKALRLSDLATVLYTSGTTGQPKGVVLAHEQIMSEVIDVFSVMTANTDDVSLTFLPYSHILGRVESWGSVYAGYTLAFAESIDRIKNNLKEVKPTFMIAVPRIFEKMYSAILTQVESNQVKRQIFERALEISKKVSLATQENRPMNLKLMLEYKLAKKLLFDKIISSFGGRLRFAVSGGAPLSVEIARFFHGIGLLICEGYGLTETTAGITFNTPLNYKFGTVGKPLEDVTIRIAEDGEVLVKSKKVMLEYFKNPSATAEVFIDGYFRTGDIGHLDADNYLCITDRKKDLIKTAGGKYVAPQKLENLLKQNPNISNVLIHGDQKKYIIALITVAPPLSNQIKDNPNDPAIYSLVRDIVAEANTQLASFESIKKFSILPDDFTVESGELTPSLKVKRKFCDQKYKKIIDELY